MLPPRVQPKPEYSALFLKYSFLNSASFNYVTYVMFGKKYDKIRYSTMRLFTSWVEYRKQTVE